MYTKGKYVVGEIQLLVGSNLGAVCISEGFGHDNLRNVFHRGEMSSAGFFHVNDDLTVTCYGESTSLRLRANPERDARLIERVLGLPGAHT